MSAAGAELLTCNHGALRGSCARPVSGRRAGSGRKVFLVCVSPSKLQRGAAVVFVSSALEGRRMLIVMMQFVVVCGG